MILCVMLVGAVCTSNGAQSRAGVEKGSGEGLRKGGMPGAAGVVIRVGGEAHEVVVSEATGDGLLTNIVLDVDRYPLMQVVVPGMGRTCRIYAGLPGCVMTSLCTVARAETASVNLTGATGWRGTKQLDFLVHCREGDFAVPFDLSVVANKDVVLEAGNAGRASPFGASPVSSMCFVESGYRQKGVTAKGLPFDRLVPSATPDLGRYILLPYDRPNVIELATSREISPTNFLIQIPRGHYSEVGVLAASQGGDASFTLILSYADGTSTTNWFEAGDWLKSSCHVNPLVGGMERVNPRDGSIDSSNRVSLCEFVFTNVVASRELAGVTIGSDPNRWPDGEKRFAAVFAVNGRAGAPPVFGP